MFRLFKKNDENIEKSGNVFKFSKSPGKIKESLKKKFEKFQSGEV